MTLAAVLMLAIALPSGLPPKHIRDAGPGYVEAVAGEIVRAAALTNVPVALLAALVVSESRLDAYAESPNGCGLGLAQINPRTRWYTEWQRACRLDMSQCRYANVVVGGYVLSDALRRCRKDRRCAIAKYRGSSRVRPVDIAVVRLSQRIAFRMRHAVRLTAWEVGSL